MKVSYFPGCTLRTKAKELDVQARACAEKLGVEPARCLVLEDSYNGVRAGARGGFITVMVPDLVPADDEMRSLYTMECASLDEVLEKLKNDQL